MNAEGHDERGGAPVLASPPRVLVLCDWYLPAVMAGGPIRTLSAMITRLGYRYHFTVVTRDRDIGSDSRFASLPQTVNQAQVGNAPVHYVDPRGLRAWRMARLLRTIPHDVLYLNSLFSVRFSMIPLGLRLLGLLPRRAVVLAPRGELGAASLMLGRSWAKKLYCRAAVLTGFLRDVTWHASSATEALEIRKIFGNAADVQVALDLAVAHDPAFDRGEPLPPAAAFEVSNRKLRVVFLSRISRIKNLKYALDILQDVQHPVLFDIFGPKEDDAYWVECEAHIRGLPSRHTVHYRGPVDHADVNAVLARYDVMLLPTMNENFGHVILEALLAGCIVITSDQTPWSDIPMRGAGWWLPLSDRDAFVSAVERCGVMDITERRIRRKAALALGIARLDDPDTVRANEHVFAHALTRERAQRAD